MRSLVGTLSFLCLFVLGACQDTFRGDVRVREVRLVREGESAKALVRAVNGGNSAAWVRTHPYRLFYEVEERSVVVAVHNDDEPRHDVGAGALAPVVEVERLARPGTPFVSSDATLSFSLAGTSKLSVDEIETVYVELGWYEDDPGQIDARQAPPDAVALAEHKIR